MIAKAKAITHGANAMRYSVDKEMAEIIRVNNLPTDITPTAMWARMTAHRQRFAEQLSHHHPLKNDAIRIEISPENNDTEGWTHTDWQKLVDEFIAVFDGIDLSKRAKRDSARRTNLRGSQYVASLHRDSRSGIRHLHIVANRVDMHGNVNDAHYIADRAMMAANIITQRHGWTLAQDRREENRRRITNDCMQVLRGMLKFEWKEYRRQMELRGYHMQMYYRTDGRIRGYAIIMGHSSFKASELGSGRNLMTSKIQLTWQKLHNHAVPHAAPDLPPAMETMSPSLRAQQSVTSRVQQIAKPTSRPESVRHTIAAGGKTYNIAVSQHLNDIMRDELDVMMLNDSLRTSVMHTALLLFAGYLDAATEIAITQGGGGQTSCGWRRRNDEDDIAWLRQCLMRARVMCQKTRRRHR